MSRKLIMKMSMSVDGFVGGPNGEGDWIFRSSDETSRAWAVELSRSSSLILLGRKSYQAMSAYWPTAVGPFAGPMNEIPKAVFTRKGFQIESSGKSGLTPAETSWASAQIHRGDLVEEIRKLKSEPGEPISAIGGAEFMRSLIAAGLIDEFYLAVHPVLLGSGLKIFDGVSLPVDLK